MDQVNLDRILLDQQEELKSLRRKNLVHRDEEQEINFDSNLAQVVIGVRRSGKSILCFNALEAAGVKYAYVNFDDERLAKVETNDLNTILLSLYRILGEFEYLFLDEIQNVEAWPLFVNRLLRQGMHILLTGSNAKLLGNELATHMTGRYSKIELYPFSFKDWCKIHNLETDVPTTLNCGLLEKAFDEYLLKGGFPELILRASNKSYINTLVNNIITQDVKNRYNIRNIAELELMVNHLLNEAPAFIVKEVLEKICDVKSDHTINKYLHYITQTYLISTVSRYSAKSRQRVRADKYYAVDVSFMDGRTNSFAGDNLGWRLETVVFLELKRRYSKDLMDIYYYKEKTAEADFVVCDRNIAIAVYQVSYDISSPKTFRREVRGLIAAAKTTKCQNLFLITDHERADIEEQGYNIAIRPAYDWLLKKRDVFDKIY